jgi:retinol dehydrogenase 12
MQKTIKMGIFHSTQTSFNPSTDIPSLKDKVILITGANSGLGKQSLLELSRHEPRYIWLASRSTSKAHELISEMKDQGYNHQIIKPIELDLSSLNSILRAARQIREQTSQLDILILNAGIMAVPPGVTENGYEIQFGTNYLGHAFLVRRLLPLLVGTAQQHGPESDVRIVLVSSTAYRYAPSCGIDFSSLTKSHIKGMSTVVRYGQSKLAVNLYGQELSKRYRALKVVIVHPGQVRTNLGDAASSSSLLMKVLWKLTSALNGVDPETGVLNQLWAATSDAVLSGKYYDPVGVINQDIEHTEQPELASKLWEWTEQQLSRFEESMG